MLRFSSEPYRDVTFFDADGDHMLQAMGCSGHVPGGLRPADLPAALEQLRAAVRASERARPDGGEEEEDEQPAVALRQRAAPLLELLEAAIAAEAHVTWCRA